MPEGHDPYGAFRHPGYRRLLASHMLATVGAEVQAVAVGWELFERTGSAGVLGMTGLAQFLPILLLALPAGHIADRYSRKLVYQLAQSGMMLASLGLAVLGCVGGRGGGVVGWRVGMGGGGSVCVTARGALVAEVVPPEDIPNAVTWNSSGWHVANVAGPALGGLVLALSGRAGWAYLLA